MHLEGTPSEQLPDVLGTGKTDIRLAFTSFSGREPDGRDAEYIEWHSLDHRPEQYRLAELRNSLRIASTPACRAVRAASEGDFDKVDHVMTYLFSDASGLPGFGVLGGALDVGGRMPLRLPSISYMISELAGTVAAPYAVAGADVIPWRPAVGVYLIVEEGIASTDDLLEVPGVAGIWSYHGIVAPPPYSTDARGRQITYCYIDADLIQTAKTLGERMRQRWADGTVKGLLAAPFYSIIPYQWDRYVPSKD